MTEISAELVIVTQKWVGKNKTNNRRINQGIKLLIFLNLNSAPFLFRFHYTFSNLRLRQLESSWNTIAHIILWLMWSAIHWGSLELLTLLRTFRKPCSGYKLKEISGSKIFAADGEDGAHESGTANHNPNYRTSVRIVQVVVVLTGIRMMNDYT